MFAKEWRRKHELLKRNNGPTKAADRRTTEICLLLYKIHAGLDFGLVFFCKINCDFF